MQRRWRGFDGGGVLAVTVAVMGCDERSDGRGYGECSDGRRRAVTGGVALDRTVASGLREQCEEKRR